MKPFAIFTTKKKGSGAITLSAEPDYNYYESLARKLNMLKYVLLSLLILFVLFGFMFFSEELSIENFRYMLKFMSVDIDSEIADGTALYFDAGGDAQALVVAGDLAIVDTNGVQIFDMTGERYLRDTDYLADPICVTNGTNLIVTDRGSNSVNIYSVYMKVYTESTSYPVYDLCASPSGCYGISTAANGYRSAIEIYDSSFRIIFHYYFSDRYITDIALSDDGKRAAAVTLTSDADGNFSGGLYIFNVYDAEDIIHYELGNEVPWNVGFRSDGAYYVLTNQSLRTYAAIDGEKAKITFEKGSLKSFAKSDDYFGLVFASSGLKGGNRVDFYNRSLEKTTSAVFENGISQIDIVQDIAYIYTLNTVCSYDIQKSAVTYEENTESNYISSLYDSSGKRLIMLYNGKVVFFNQNRFTNINSEE